MSQSSISVLIIHARTVAHALVILISLYACALWAILALLVRFTREMYVAQHRASIMELVTQLALINMSVNVRQNTKEIAARFTKHANAKMVVIVRRLMVLARNY